MTYYPTKGETIQGPFASPSAIMPEETTSISPDANNVNTSPIETTLTNHPQMQAAPFPHLSAGEITDPCDDPDSETELASQVWPSGEGILSEDRYIEATNPLTRLDHHPPRVGDELRSFEDADDALRGLPPWAPNNPDRGENQILMDLQSFIHIVDQVLDNGIPDHESFLGIHRKLDQPPPWSQVGMGSDPGRVRHNSALHIFVEDSGRIAMANEGESLF